MIPCSQRCLRRWFLKPAIYTCDACGAPIPQRPAGRVKRLCNSTCREIRYARNHCTRCNIQIDPVANPTGHCTQCEPLRNHRRGRPRPGQPLSMTYDAIHGRLRAARGSATANNCVGCGKQAQYWAYDHRDPDERTQLRYGRVYAYSIKFEHYHAMCRSCHEGLDARLVPGVWSKETWSGNSDYLPPTRKEAR